MSSDTPENTPNQQPDFDTQIEEITEELEWLRARQGLRDRAAPDIELKQQITRAEARLADLLVTQLAWAGLKPQLPDLLN
ncbi:hypothetical protein [Paraburkholderia dipogonis]|uniref:hypothetical protein n=1 Tax=Paraburkholderia dipogonis TaxID=1211383 RepID=UPI0038B7431E